MWIEMDHTKGLRARITQTLDAAETQHSVGMATTSEDICSVVKRWVEDFEARNLLMDEEAEPSPSA